MQHVGVYPAKAMSDALRVHTKILTNGKPVLIYQTAVYCFATEATIVCFYYETLVY